ncbi:MAG: nucleotidyltransferase domain-containing protein [Treponema sp.]|nr:nucleotidyltransferase domain-containing protein [Treponema sp.]
MVKIKSKKKNLDYFNNILKNNPNYLSLRYKDKISFIRETILSSVKNGVIKKIYIFGSYCNGKANEDSDIDICVIINNKQNRSDISLKIRINLTDNDLLWCDLLVYKEDVFYNIKNTEGVENTILKEGVLIYG